MSDIPVSGAPAPQPVPGEVTPHFEQVPRPLEADFSEPHYLKPAHEAKVSADVKQAHAKVQAKNAAENARTKVLDQQKAAQERAQRNPSEENADVRRSRDIKETLQRAKGLQEASQQEKDRFRDVPNGFDKRFQGEWDATPHNIKAEIHRRTAELENGFHKYRKSAESYESVRKYDEIARSNGRDLRQGLETILQIEDTFRRDPIAGLDQTFRALNAKKADGSPVTLRDVASYVMSMTPDQLNAHQQHSAMQYMQQRVQNLDSEVTNRVNQAMTHQTVKAFADKHEDFEAFGPVNYPGRPGRCA